MILALEIGLLAKTYSCGYLFSCCGRAFLEGLPSKAIPPFVLSHEASCCSCSSVVADSSSFLYDPALESPCSLAGLPCLYTHAPDCAIGGVKFQIYWIFLPVVSHDSSRMQ